MVSTVWDKEDVGWDGCIRSREGSIMDWMKLSSDIGVGGLTACRAVRVVERLWTGPELSWVWHMDYGSWGGEGWG